MNQTKRIARFKKKLKEAREELKMWKMAAEGCARILQAVQDASVPDAGVIRQKKAS